MKSTIILIVLNLCVSAILISQPLHGIKTIPGSFPNIQQAIVSLNLNGVDSGGVTFEITAGYTETFSNASAGLITTNSSNQSNPILFRKVGNGANPLIISGAGVSSNADGIIKIQGTDFLTFDGINVSDNPLNINNTTRMEWGFAILKQNGTNGSNNITIKNCKISLNKLNIYTCGIYQANHTAASTLALTITSTEGESSNNKYFNDTITGAYNPIQISGSTVEIFYDKNTQIGVDGGNYLMEFGGSTSICYGIYAIYQQNLQICNNSIVGGNGSLSSLYGIYLSTGINSNIKISKNNISLTVSGTTGFLSGIYNLMGSIGINNVVLIDSNTIQNCIYSSAVSPNIYFIDNEASVYDLQISNNQISNFTTPTYGALYCIIQNGAVTGTSKINNNIISNISRTSQISSNPLYGIYNLPNTNITTEIFKNTITNITSEGASGLVAGIVTGAGLIHTIYKNKISNLTNNSVYGLVNGFFTAASSTTIRLTNNYISELYTPNAFGLNSVIGINFSIFTNVYCYFNTIFLDATSSTNLYFGTSGVNISGVGTIRFSNNIVINTSSQVGTGYTAAMRKTGGIYSTTSNNNCFYAGIPSTYKLIYFENSYADQTIASLRNRLFPAESNSNSEFPPFLNSSISPYNLHIDSLTATQCENGGTFNLIPFSIFDDYDGNTRNSQNPDIGADEGIFLQAADLNGPNISFQDISNTLSTTAPILDNVYISDKSNVNITSNKPRIYFKKSTDANSFTAANNNTGNGWKWVETADTISPFTFEINYNLLRTSVVAGDIIQYFVVAQDAINPPNVTSFPSLGFNGNLVSNISTSPTTPKSYRILLTISGDIDIPGNYPNLTGTTGLFNDINNKVLNGNIVVKIKENITEPGSISLNEWLETGAGNYTITIKPDTCIERKLSGFKNSGGLISINGADRVTIDGSYNGTGTYLSFTNTSNLSNSAVIVVGSTGPAKGANNNTIRNCKIIGASNTVSNIFGIFVATTSVIPTTYGGADIQNLSIIDNEFTTLYYGIFAKGVETTGLMNNLSISGNSIGSLDPSKKVAYRGIEVANANVSSIKENHIFNLSTNSINNVSAIEIGTSFTNSFISRNKIHGLKNNYYFNDLGDEYVGGAIGINIAGTGSNNIQIDNNIIYNITSCGGKLNTIYKNPYGIIISSGNNHKVYFNSVNMYGSFLDTSTTSVGFSSAFIINSLSVSGCDVKNNIFVNKMTSSNAGTKSYSIYALTTSNFSAVNHNDYFVSGSQGMLAYLSSNKNSLSDWKTTATCDSNSVNVNPSFTTDTNLFPLTSSAIIAAAIHLPIINYDFYGFTRSIFPSLGAFEITGTTYNADAGITSVVYPTLSICEGVQNITVSLKNFSPNTLNSALIQWQVNGVSMPNFQWTGSLLSNASANIIIGNYNFVSSVSYSISASTTSPNTYIDINPTNDNFVKSGIIVKPKPNIIYVSDTITQCYGAIGSLTGSLSGVAPWTITYTDNLNNFIANNILSQNFSIAITTDSSRSYYFKTISDGNGCSDSISKQSFVTLIDPPDAKTINDTLICQGSIVSIGSAHTANSTYFWSPSTGLNSNIISNPIASPNTTTTYTLTQLHGPGCMKQKSVVIKVKSTPNILIVPNGPTQFCPGDSVILNTNGDVGLTYEWQLNNIPINGSSNSSIIANTAGNYSVFVTDSVGCTNISSPVFITVLTQPNAITVPSGVVTLCQGDSIVLNANTGVGYTYQWLKNGNQIPGAITKSMYVNSSGIYQVSITNSNYCTNKSSYINIIVNPSPNAIISTNNLTTICSGDSVELTASFLSSQLYKWFKDDIQIPNFEGSVFYAKSSGTYKALLTNSLNCSKFSNSIQVFSNPSPIFDFGSDTTICHSTSISLNAGNGATSYIWSNGNTNQTIVVDTSTFGLGTFTIWAKATNLVGCFKTDTIQITIVNCTGIDEIKENSISIYPNPSKGIFHIDYTFDEEICISVFSITSDLLLEQKINSNSTIDLSIYPKGIYILRIKRSNGQAYFRKVIVE